MFVKMSHAEIIEQKMAYATIEELSITNFKNLIRETINETIAEFFSNLDDGLILKEKAAKNLGLER